MSIYQCVSQKGGGDGGIRTLDTRIGYGSLAGNWFQPLTHVSGSPRRTGAYNGHVLTRQVAQLVFCLWTHTTEIL